MRDLIVAGGGPVGLATALYAARAGLDVVVREPRHGVIDKACGEGLMPGGVLALADLGVDPVGMPLAGIRYVSGRRTVEARFSAGPGRGVRRTTLHAAMLEAVARAGVEVEHRAVDRVESHHDHVLVDGERARYLAAADGLHSPIRRQLRLDATANEDWARRYGLRRHVNLRPWTDLVEVHWSPYAEAYVTPVAPDQLGVAVLSSRRRSFADALDDFPELCGRFTGIEPTRVRGAGPFRQRSSRRVEGRVLLVGDAAGYVDALTGEGIALGMAQARAAVVAVASEDLRSYERVWRELTRRHERLTRGLVGATRVKAVRRALVPAAALLPGVFEAAVDSLARPA